MNVANLELSKRLYELSGWGMLEGHNEDTTLSWHTSEHTPLYPLGYLLRKLPPYSRIQTMKGDVPYRVSYDNGVSERGVNADTPEDAACLLAIRLFEEGIVE